uniref:Uncharacterized protein n=1 Tax=Anguilla anguilla TaxID=7936 RepID=A0A0E9SSP1_ANGAN
MRVSVLGRRVTSMFPWQFVPCGLSVTNCPAPLSSAPPF